VAERAAENKCCTQVLVDLALEDVHRSDHLFVDAVAPLCLGLRSGLTCGALLGGLVAMAILSDRALDEVAIREFVEWFVDRFGAADCSAILQGDPFARLTRCPSIVGDVYREALVRSGHSEPELSGV